MLTGGGGRVALGTLVEYLPALACPAMMVFCMRGLMGGGKHVAQQAPAQTSEERRLALQLEMRELDKARLARGEMTLEEFVHLYGPEPPVPEGAQDASPAPLRAAPTRRRAHAG